MQGYDVRTQVLSCPDCAVVGLFEQPPCDDGHGVDCADWVCTGCGYAATSGWREAVAVVAQASAA